MDHITAKLAASLEALADHVGQYHNNTDVSGYLQDADEVLAEWKAQGNPVDGAITIKLELDVDTARQLVKLCERLDHETLEERFTEKHVMWRTRNRRAFAMKMGLNAIEAAIEKEIKA